MSILNNVSAVKKFTTVKLNGCVPVREVTIFGCFGACGSVFCPPAKPPGYRFQNINFQRRFDNLKNFPTEKLNGRAPVRRVSIFGRFVAWGSVFCPPANPAAYRLLNINFERCFGNLKIFSTEKLNGLNPVREVTIFEVSEPEEAISAFRRSHRLTVWKMSILNDVSSLKNFRTEKLKFWFQVGKWPFLDVSKPEKAYSALRQCHRLTFKKYRFGRRFGNLKKFPTEKLNCRVPIREVTIFGRFGAWESVLRPPENRRLTVCKMKILNDVSALKTFSSNKLNGLVGGREVTIFGRFEAWGMVFALRQSLLLTVCKMSILNDVSAIKNFSTEKLNGRVPGGKCPFLDVSEPEEAYSALR